MAPFQRKFYCAYRHFSDKIMLPRGSVPCSTLVSLQMKNIVDNNLI